MNEKYPVNGSVIMQEWRNKGPDTARVIEAICAGIINPAKELDLKLSPEDLEVIKRYAGLVSSEVERIIEETRSKNPLVKFDNLLVERAGGLGFDSSILSDEKNATLMDINRLRQGLRDSEVCIVGGPGYGEHTITEQGERQFYQVVEWDRDLLSLERLIGTNLDISESNDAKKPAIISTGIEGINFQAVFVKREDGNIKVKYGILFDKNAIHLIKAFPPFLPNLT